MLAPGVGLALAERCRGEAVGEQVRCALCGGWRWRLWFRRDAQERAVFGVGVGACHAGVSLMDGSTMRRCVGLR
jgi:hypothetical protein